MASYWRATFGAGLAALLIGGALGIGTVHGVQPRTAAAAPIYPRATLPVEPAYAEEATDCPDCTGFDAGYRWASARRIVETDACFGDDWSRQSGCLAYVRASQLN
jgi:hypothetical protein